MRLDPRGVIAGFEVADTSLPATLTCPICVSSAKLDTRSLFHITCRNCGFIGDFIQLFAVTCKYSLEGAITVLKARGSLDLSEIEQSSYMAAYEQQSKLRELLKERAEDLRTQPHGSVLSMLTAYGCRFQYSDLIKLTPHIIPLHREQLDELELTYPKSAKETLSWWGRFMAMAIPCWDGVAIVGFWLITPSGYNYLPLTERSTNAVGFGLVPRIFDPLAFVIDNPIQALRFTLWSIVHTGKPVGFLVPYGSQEALEAYKAKSTVYWSPSQSVSWFFRALSTPGATSLLNEGLARSYDPKVDLPCEGSFPQFLRYVDLYAKPSHQALTNHLLSLPLEKAREELQGVAIEPVDKAKCRGYVNGEELKRLDELFDAHLQVKTVTWNGGVVTETPGGWVYKGRIISTAILSISEIHPIGATGDAWLTGCITYNGVSYPFREKHSVIKRRPAAWIQAQVIAKAGQIPFIEKTWSSKLVEIAQQFSLPKPVMSGQSYGWDGGTLQLPNFTVDSRGVLPSKATVEGPSILLPGPLSDAERENFKEPAIKRLYLVLLGGLLKSKDGDKPPGILLVDSVSALPRLVDVLGAEIVSGLSAADIAKKGVKPIPPVSLDLDVAKLFTESDPPYVMAQASRTTADAAVSIQNWVTVEIDSPVDFRVLRGVFLDLPGLLVNPPKSKTTFYRDIARYLSDRHKGRSFFADAGDLDLQMYNATSNRHLRFTEYLAKLARAGVISLTEEKDEVRIPIREVCSHTKKHGVALPPVGTLTELLTHGGALVGATKDYWAYSLYSWNFYRSFS